MYKEKRGNNMDRTFYKTKFSPVVVRFLTLLVAAFIFLPIGNSAFAQQVDNPDLEWSCGMDVTLVLDESGSIQLAGAIDQVRDAARAFILAVRDTGARVRIVEFNRDARTGFPLTEVTSDNISDFEDYIYDVANNPDTGYDPSNYRGHERGTNWEAALREIVTDPTPLAVFFTDGDPTYYLVDPDNTTVGGTGSSANTGNILTSYNQALPAADEVKLAGIHILAIGAGPNIDSQSQLDRLIGISGPDLIDDVDDYHPALTDVITVEEFEDLAIALRDVALSACTPAVTFTKFTKDYDETEFTPEQNWEFTSTVEPSQFGTEVIWRLPNLGSTNPTQSAVTNADGSVHFQWTLGDLINPLQVDSIFTWDETLLDYSFVDANCIRRTFNPDGIVEQSFQMLLLESVIVGANELVTCDVRNEQIASLAVVKDLASNADEDGSQDVSVGDTLMYTITATNDGTISLSNVVVSDDLTGDSTTCALVTVGDTCVLETSYVVQVGELGTTIHNVGTADSDETDPVSDPEDVPVPIPSLIIVKDLTGNADEDGSGDVSVGDTLMYTLTATNNGTANLTNVVVDDDLTGASTSCTLVAPGDTCVLETSYVVQPEDAGTTIHNVGTADSDQTPPVIDPEDVPVALRAQINGHLYIDTNGNGSQDAGEPDLANVDVVITDSNGDVQTVSTDGNGNYTATVPPGDTITDIDESDPDYPAGATQTEGTDPTTTTAVAGGDTFTENDGFYVPAQINGHLYIDTNGNGSQDAGEPDLANVDVVITDSNGDVQTVSTDGNGNYTATVPPGDTITDIDESDPDYPAGATQTEGTDPTTTTSCGRE